MERFELKICRDVHPVAIELNVCYTSSLKCRQISQPAVY
jgi:hypothetical protein